MRIHHSARPADRPAPTRPQPTRAAAPTEAPRDIEVSIRVFADGRTISVARRLAPESGDGPRRTIGIDAVVR
jgi:hypothetical protein